MHFIRHTLLLITKLIIKKKFKRVLLSAIIDLSVEAHTKICK